MKGRMRWGENWPASPRPPEAEGWRFLPGAGRGEDEGPGGGSRSAVSHGSLGEPSLAGQGGAARLPGGLGRGARLGKGYSVGDPSCSPGREGLADSSTGPNQPAPYPTPGGGARVGARPSGRVSRRGGAGCTSRRAAPRDSRVWGSPPARPPGRATATGLGAGVWEEVLRLIPSSSPGPRAPWLGGVGTSCRIPEVSEGRGLLSPQTVSLWIQEDTGSWAWTPSC